ncbi:MAG: ankyrin repeat domain-containing protein [Firmicutes bacterium]|nr:ankyrin repeat domain-containing protein [Bacillota bacterium]
MQVSPQKSKVSNQEIGFILLALIFPLLFFLISAFFLFKKNEGTILMAGINTNQKWIVKVCIDTGINLNKQYSLPYGITFPVYPKPLKPYRTTPLILACTVRKLGIAKILIHDGGLVNQSDKYGVTPLLAAAAVSRLSPLFVLKEVMHKGQEVGLVRFLLRHGADVNCINHREQTPLVLAAQSGSFQVVQLLLRHHAALHVRDRNGKTPLMYAALGGNLKIIKFLLSRGVSPAAEDKNGSTAAALSKNFTVAKFLLSRLPMGLRSLQANRFYLLMGKRKEWYYLYQPVLPGVNLANVRSSHSGMTLLFYAVLQNNLYAARYLLSHGANVNARDNIGQTPLMLSCLHVEYPMTKVLVRAGASINLQDDQGRTALMYSITSARYAHLTPNLGISFYLISKGAKLNLKDRKGRTALWYAERESQQIITLINGVYNSKATRETRARMKNIVKTLKQHGAH